MGPDARGFGPTSVSGHVSLALSAARSHVVVPCAQRGLERLWARVAAWPAVEAP